MMRRYCLIIFASLSLWLPGAHAFEYGLLHVPQHLEPLRRLLISHPRQCLIDVSQQLEKSTSNNTLLLNQIAALCAYRSQQPKLALHYISSAIEQASLRPDKQRLMQSHLIKSQLLSLSPNNADQSLFHLQQAIDLANQSGAAPNQEIQFHIQRVTANRLRNLGQLSEAKNHYLKAKEIAYTLDNTVMKAWSESMLARYYLSDKQPQLALSHFNEALHFADGSQPEALLFSSLITSEIAAIYQAEDELAQARAYQQLAIEAAVQLDSPDLTASLLTKLGEQALSTQDMNFALSHFLNAKDIARASNNRNSLAKIELRLGQAYAELNDYQPAVLHLQTARQLYQQLNLPSYELKALLSLGELHIQQNEAGFAILLLRKAEELAATIGLSNNHNDVYLLLSRAYENSGDFAEALEEFKLYHQLSSQYQHLRNLQAKSSTKSEYQYIEQAQQLSDVTREKAALQKQYNYQQMVVAVISLLFIIALIVHFSIRQRLKQLQGTEQELRQQHDVHAQTGWLKLQHQKQAIQMLKALAHSSESSNHIVLMISVDKLQTLPMRALSQSQRKEIVWDFIRYLQQHCDGELFLGHLSDAKYLATTELASYSPSQLLMALQTLSQRYQQQQQLQFNLNIGCCLSPFLVKAKDSIDDQRLQEIASLALEGAQQLSLQSQQGEWLELKAMAGSPAAFFCNDIVTDTKQALAKGLVKITSSADKSLIKW